MSEKKEIDEAALKKVNLTTEDISLLKAAATGEGAIPLTVDLMRQIGASIDERNKDIQERYPQLVKDCPYETRLAVAAWVFQAIVDHATEGGSYRHLIYGRLGFGPDAYLPLYNAGGMTISNEFDLTKEKPNE